MMKAALLVLLACLPGGARAESLLIGLPGLPWSLQAQADGVRVRKNGPSQDGSSAKLMVTREKDGLTFSVYMEKMPDLKSAKDCREFYWKRASQDTETREDLALSDSRGTSRVEYTVSDFGGMHIVQKHVHAYLWKDGVCADAHLIMVGYKPSSRKDVEVILKSLRFVKTPIGLKP